MDLIFVVGSILIVLGFVFICVAIHDQEIPLLLIGLFLAVTGFIFALFIFAFKQPPPSKITAAEPSKITAAEVDVYEERCAHVEYGWREATDNEVTCADGTVIKLSKSVLEKM